MEVAPLRSAQDLRELASWSHRAPGSHLQALRPIRVARFYRKKSVIPPRPALLDSFHCGSTMGEPKLTGHAAIVCLLVGYLLIHAAQDCRATTSFDAHNASVNLQLYLSFD